MQLTPHTKLLITPEMEAEMERLVKEQTAEGHDVWALVVDDVSAWQLRPEEYTDPDPLVNVYHRTIDQLVYMRAEIERRRDYEREIRRLETIVDSLADRVYGQSELLSARAEKGALAREINAIDED